MFLMNAVIAVFNSLSMRGQSRYDDNQIYVHRNFPNTRYFIATGHNQLAHFNYLLEKELLLYDHQPVCACVYHL
jgi:hypothetical protein